MLRLILASRPQARQLFLLHIEREVISTAGGYPDLEVRCLYKSAKPGSNVYKGSTALITRRPERRDWHENRCLAVNGRLDSTDRKRQRNNWEILGVRENPGDNCVGRRRRYPCRGLMASNNESKLQLNHKAPSFVPSLSGTKQQTLLRP